MPPGPFRGIERACTNVEEICAPNVYAGAVLADDVDTPLVQRECMNQLFNTDVALRKEPRCAEIMEEVTVRRGDVRPLISGTLNLMWYDMEPDDERQAVQIECALVVVEKIRHLLAINPPELERHAGLSRHQMPPNWREQALRATVDIRNLTDPDQFEDFLHSLATARGAQESRRIARREQEREGMLGLLKTKFETGSPELLSRLSIPANPLATFRERQQFESEYVNTADQIVPHLRPESVGLRDHEALIRALYICARQFRQSFYKALSISQQLRDDALWDDLPAEASSAV